MTNNIEKYAPKKYHEAITDIYKDMDGWWVELKPEYVSTSTGTSTIHEFTVADMKKEFKTIERVEEEIIEESNEGLAVLDQFLAEWKESARTYYEELREEYFAESERVHEITAYGLRKVIHFYTYERVYSDDRIDEILSELPTMDDYEAHKIQKKVSEAMYKEWLDEHTKKDIDIIKSMYAEGFLEDVLNKEVAHKRKNFIAKVEKKAGEIVDASGLTIGVDGSINGYVVGTKKKVHVETIYAGGYNIQCLHYRLLVK